MDEHENHERPLPEHWAAQEETPAGRPIGLRRARAPQLRTPRAAGVAGIIFTLLLVASLLMLETVPGDLTDTETVAWFKDSVASDLYVAGLYLIPFAGIAFLWFIAVVRDRIGRFEDRFFSTVFLGTGLLFIAMIFAGMATAGSLVAGARFAGLTEHPDADLIRSTSSLAYTFIFVYGAKMAGVFVLVTNTIAFRTRVFSRWVALLGYVAGLILLLNLGFYDQRIVSGVFPVWVFFLSAYILITAPRVGADGQEAAAAP